MKVTLLLADAAQAVGGKLYLLGGGWSSITAGAPFAIAGKIEVPWSQGTDRHTWRLELVDADGHPFTLAGQGDEPQPQPLWFEQQFNTGIPPGLTPGTPLDHVFAVTVGPGLPLVPGTRYQWRLTIDGHEGEDWYVGFNTRAATPQPPDA